MALPSTQSSGKENSNPLSVFQRDIFALGISSNYCVLEQLGIEVLILEITWSWQSRTRTEIALRQACVAGEPVRCGVSLPYHLPEWNWSTYTREFERTKSTFSWGHMGSLCFSQKKKKEPQRRFSARVSSPMQKYDFSFALIEHASHVIWRHLVKFPKYSNTSLRSSTGCDSSSM